MKRITTVMATVLVALSASYSLFATEQIDAVEDVAAFEAGLKAAKPKLMAVKLLAATSGSTVYPASGSDMNVTGRKGVPLDLYFNVTMASVSSATLYLNAYDVDYPSATERDDVYFNGTYLGRLQGYNNGENMNTFDVPARLVKTGSNVVHIDVDVDTSGNWVTQMRDGTKLVLNGEEGTVTLTASQDLLNKIELNWSANYSGAAPYNVYRGKTRDNLTIYREGLTVTSFTDTEVEPGEMYYYQIKTMSGVSSTIEEAKSIKGVVSVLASQDLYHKVQLSWTTENCTGPFTIYRGETAEAVLNSQLRTKVVEGLNAYTYVDDGVNGGQDSYYLIVASNGADSSPVRGSNLLAKVKLEVSDDCTDCVKLKWSCPVEGLKYKIYKSIYNDRDFYEWPKYDWYVKEEYRDGNVSAGQNYYYFVKSSLGVESEVVSGRKILDAREPKLSFSIEGFTPYTKGLSDEDNILVEGCKLHCKIVLENPDFANYNRMRRFVLVGHRSGGAFYQKDHLITCDLTGMWDGNANAEMAEWQQAILTSHSQSTWSFSVVLDSGRGCHGRYKWDLSCEYEKAFGDGKLYSTTFHGGLKNVYFNKNLTDNGSRNWIYGTFYPKLIRIPNWFAYWKEDGACPTLKNPLVKYRGEKIENGMCGGEHRSNKDGSTDVIYIDSNAAEPWNRFFVNGCVLSGSQVAKRIHNWVSQDRRFFEWNVNDSSKGGYCGRWVGGIYQLEDTLAHELQHGKTKRRYIDQTKNVSDENLVNSDMFVGELDCVFDTRTYGVCQVLNGTHQIKINDYITDADERSNFWLGSSGLNLGFPMSSGDDSVTDSRHPDTYGLMSLKSWQYGAYGDDELISMLAGRKGMLNARWERDWAYPGEQAGGLLPEEAPMVKSTSTFVSLSAQNQKKLLGTGLSLEEVDDNIKVGTNYFVQVVSASCCALSDEVCVTGLEYSVGVELDVCEPVTFSGYLVGEDGKEIAVSRVVARSDTKLLKFTYEAKEIYRQGIEGPYKLDKIEMTIEGEGGSNVVVGTLHSFVLDPLFVSLSDLSCEAGTILNACTSCVSDDSLVISVSVRCNKSGDCRVRGVLSDTNGNYVARSRAAQVMSVGTNEVALTFAGAEIYNSAHDGPYVLSSVQLWFGDEMVDAATDLLTTEEAYSYEDFKPADTVVTVDRESGAFVVPVASEDGSLGALRFSFDVNNETEETLCYRLSANLVGESGETAAIQSAKYVYLEPGENHLEVAFAASAIASNGVDGPYAIGAIELVHQDAAGNDLTFRPTVVTDAYSASDFGCVPVAFSDEPSAKEPLECDTPTVELPFVANRPCTVVVAATLIGTNGEFIARASVTNQCEAAGAQLAVIAFPREALVSAGQRGPFSVAYFALTPLIDGEEAIYSDTFELTDIEWVDWEGMFDWDVENGEASAALYKGTNVIVRVPSVACGVPVISVGPCAFLDCDWLAEVVLPAGIENIGIGAFFGTSLTAVELPETVVGVGNAAFNVEGLGLIAFDGPPPASAADAYPRGAVGTYRTAYASAWEAELNGGCLWNGLTMVPEGTDPNGYESDSGWTVLDPADASAHDGKRTFRSAETSDGSSTALAMSVEEQSTVSFWWKTSCEGSGMDDFSGDHAEFLVDGVVVERIAGDSCWKQVVVAIPGSGEHQLSWRYVKDSTGASGSDCVWVSDVAFSTVAGEMTRGELLPESGYNWFYEDTPTAFTEDEPFEYNPPLAPEKAICQIEICTALGEIDISTLEEEDAADAQAGIGRIRGATGLDYAVLTSEGWTMVGNESVGSGGKVSVIIDYSSTPSKVKYMVSGHSLTNGDGIASFTCSAQKSAVEALVAKGDGTIESWAGKYEVVNSDIQEVAPDTETELAENLDKFPNETFQVTGGGALVIPSDKIPAGGVNRKLHVDSNSTVKFDLSGLSAIPTVTKLFNGVGSSFVLGSNIQLVVPGEGVDRVSKLFVKDGNLEARVAERPTFDDSASSGSAFALNADGNASTATASIGNAVEGFWYGLLTTELLTSDFMLDPDSVKQCTSTGVLSLESSANAGSDSNFYRVSVSAEKP